MKIILAPDSFKESLSASKVAQAMAEGFARVFPEAELVQLPLGDGGEGTIDTLSQVLHLPQNTFWVTHALGQIQATQVATDNSQAYFEVASVVGLESLPLDQRQPLNLTTRGVGELIGQLANHSFRRLTIGVGGTATNDAGIGMAQGLGYRFLDKDKCLIDNPLQNLSAIASIDASQVCDLSDLTIEILSDVSNPLCGPHGASLTFGPQKGLSQQEAQTCDQDFKAFYQRFFPEILEVKGAGAGGGLAAGLMAFAGAEIRSGIDAVLDHLAFDQQVADADLVLVGEGRMDRQSLAGKAPIGVAKRTPAGVPVFAICGSLSADLPEFPQAGIQAAFSIIPRLAPLEQTFSEAYANIVQTTAALAQALKVSL
ncbi:glycerate kinase [Streptococcus sp. DD12]|uniref:glycerate kinase n=1 Tax=Streptococcus sp. DD12 TaxID=1777880 RepID=UPI000798B84A|nr:glycerate kinase [Streptococcus sp. DD12]KXT76800.1 Glycerate kinase [Streptococcus sp. DD12]